MEKPVRILQEIADLSKKMASGKYATAEEAFNQLRKYLGSDVNIKYEVIGAAKTESLADAVPNEQSAQTDEISTPETVSTSNAEQHVSTGENRRGFAKLNGLEIGRVLLIASKNQSNSPSELSSYCNGLVLNYPSWEVLSSPPRIISYRFKTSELKRNLSNYSIYEVFDGTVLTLYWFKDRWCISTTNGFDVSNYLWMGKLTYMDAVLEISKQYPEFHFDKLDKNMSYTIGVRHNDFHPLMADGNKMWLIQVVDTTTCAVVTDSKKHIGIPIQGLAKTPELAGNKLFQWLVEENETALAKYHTSIRNDSKSPTIHYGFILRTLHGGPDIFLESTLYKRIRFLVYNLPKSHANNRVVINGNNRLEYIILRAYLSVSTKNEFLNLFPQFKSYYSNYDAIFNKFTNRIINELRSNKSTRVEKKATNTAVANASSPIAAEKAKLNSNIDDLVGVFTKHIEEQTTRIKVMEPEGYSIVLDFVMNLQYLDLYFMRLINYQDSTA